MKRSGVLAFSLGCSALLCIASWQANAQVLERGVEGAAVGAIIGGIVGGGKGAAAGAGIGAGVGALSGAAEANARAQEYYGPPSGYGPPPGYYPPPPRYRHGQYGAPPPGYYAPPRRTAAVASISVAPPPLPIYDQPICPGPGYIWTPGHWAYAAGDYFWVPGTWVQPPAVGLFWTPGFWGYESQRYIWHAGYWGPHVGYYGGINYGFGYFGSGYEGGHWQDGVFFYNTAVSKINPALVTNSYNQEVASTGEGNTASFNGSGGIAAQPSAQEVAWSRERHTPPTALQVKHQRAANADQAFFAAVNHGKPTIAATAKAGVFKGPDVVGSKPVLTADATASAATPDHKTVPQSKDAVPLSETASQQASLGQHFSNGPIPQAATHALSGPTNPNANETSEASSPAKSAPNANTIPPDTTSSIAVSKPSSAALPTGSSASPPAGTAVDTTHTASLEVTTTIPPGTTHFGIEIGTVNNRTGLQGLWRDILDKHPALVAGLEPRQMLTPDKKWQLIAGPFASTAEATRMCDLFKKQNLSCRATAFAGEQL